jgi:hypothetical protein
MSQLTPRQMDTYPAGRFVRQLLADALGRQPNGEEFKLWQPFYRLGREGLISRIRARATSNAQGLGELGALDPGQAPAPGGGEMPANEAASYYAGGGAIYSDFVTAYGRNPTRNEFLWWQSNALTTAQTDRLALMQQAAAQFQTLTQAAQWRAQIQQFYRTYLNREPTSQRDLDGVNFWLEEVTRGIKPISEVEADFAGLRRDAENFVNECFSTYFHRAPGPDFPYWLNRVLSEQETRETLRAQLQQYGAAELAEQQQSAQAALDAQRRDAESFVHAAIATYHYQPHSAGEVTHWIEEILSGTPRADVENNIRQNAVLDQVNLSPPPGDGVIPGPTPTGGDVPPTTTGGTTPPATTGGTTPTPTGGGAIATTDTGFHLPQLPTWAWILIALIALYVFGSSGGSAKTARR